ncbi:MAG: hypothetical protein IJ860_04665 [Eubacterium sp.]|nr:hypothetical protein [Eubacterium sp.]
MTVCSFTLPAQRSERLQFLKEDLVVIGFPTYAGKLPNKILPDLKKQILGTDTHAVALVTFGNRSFDNALAELCAVMSGNGFRVIGAAAVPTEHAFLSSAAYRALAEGKRGFAMTGAIGAGLPDVRDFQKLKGFARATGEKIRRGKLEKSTGNSEYPARSENFFGSGFFITCQNAGNGIRGSKGGPKVVLRLSR